MSKSKQELQFVAFKSTTLQWSFKGTSLELERGIVSQWTKSDFIILPSKRIVVLHHPVIWNPTSFPSLWTNTYRFETPSKWNDRVTVSFSSDKLTFSKSDYSVGMQWDRTFHKQRYRFKSIIGVHFVKTLQQKNNKNTYRIKLQNWSFRGCFEIEKIQSKRSTQTHFQSETFSRTLFQTELLKFIIFQSVVFIEYARREKSYIWRQNVNKK